MAKRWLQSVDLEIDPQGRPLFETALVALAALIADGRLKVDAAGVTLTADLIDLDVEAITGTAPNAADLYDLAQLLTGIDGDTGSMATDLGALAGVDFATDAGLDDLHDALLGVGVGAGGENLHSQLGDLKDLLDAGAGATAIAVLMAAQSDLDNLVNNTGADSPLFDSAFGTSVGDELADINGELSDMNMALNPEGTNAGESLQDIASYLFLGGPGVGLGDYLADMFGFGGQYGSNPLYMTGPDLSVAELIGELIYNLASASPLYMPGPGISLSEGLQSAFFNSPLMGSPLFYNSSGSPMLGGAPVSELIGDLVSGEGNLVDSPLYDSSVGLSAGDLLLDLGQGGITPGGSPMRTDGTGYGVADVLADVFMGQGMITLPLLFHDDAGNSAFINPTSGNSWLEDIDTKLAAIKAKTDQIDFYNGNLRVATVAEQP